MVGLFTTIIRWGLLEAVAKLTEIVGFIDVFEAAKEVDSTEARVAEELLL